jgi:hypothetical protein
MSNHENGSMTAKMQNGNGKNVTTPMTLAAVREELKGVKGKKYWRSLDELGGYGRVSGGCRERIPVCRAGVGGPG